MSSPGPWIQRAARTAAALAEAIGAGERVLLIGGESGSGKSSLAEALAAVLPRRCAVLSQDDWYHLGPRTNEARRRADPAWRGPVELDLEGLSAAIEAWRGGAERLSVPRFEGEQRTERVVDVSEVEILLIEGTFALALPGEGLRILLTEDWRGTEAGRRARGRDPLDAHSASVLAEESRLVQAHRDRAHVWVDAAGRLQWREQARQRRLRPHGER